MRSFWESCSNLVGVRGSDAAHQQVDKGPRPTHGVHDSLVPNNEPGGGGLAEAVGHQLAIETL